MMTELSPDIIVVIEMWLIVDVNCSPIIAGYICIGSDRVINHKGGWIILYVRDCFCVKSSSLEAHDCGACEIACCIIKSGHALVTMEGIYRSPYCLAGGFDLSHICF